MSQDPENVKIGEIFQESYECETITWKIPNVSLLEITDDTEVRSPCFSYKKATWILKMHLYTTERSIIIVQIERLHSEIPVHELLCKAFFKDRDMISDSNWYVYLEINKNIQEGRIYLPYIMIPHWYSLFYHSSECRSNDTISLIVNILNKKDAETKSLETAIGSNFTKNEDSLQSTGELFVEAFGVDIVAWKISKMYSIPVQVDNSVLSPMFSFAGASWILKLFLYGQTRFKSENNVDVFIERLQSTVQKHPVSYKILVKPFDKNESLLENYLDMIYVSDVKGFFTFDTDHVQENIIELKSYNEFVRLAGSNQQFGTVALIGVFQFPKKPKIQLSFQVSVQPGGCHQVDLLGISGNSEKLKVGEIIKKPFECEVVSWRIPNVSSLLTSEDSSIQSPLFSYKGAIWNFKMYPYGHAHTNKTGTVEVEMQKLHSQIPVPNVFCRFFFKTHCVEFNDLEIFSIFYSSNEQLKLSFAWPIFYYYKNFRYNDTLTLVCEVYSMKNSEIEVEFNRKSCEAVLDNRSTTNDTSCKSVGELVAESFDVEVITWKIPKIRSISAEVDKGVQSPSFPFAGASWILTMFPYGQTKFESETNIDLAIDRVYFLFPKHPVSYKVFFKAFEKDFDEKGYLLENFRNINVMERENSFIFEANNTRENICKVMSYSDLFSLEALNQPSDTAFLKCYFRIKNNYEKRLDVLPKSVQLHTGILQNISKEKTVSSASPKGLSQETPKKEPFTPFGDSVFSFKGSSPSKAESVAPFRGFSFKGLSQNTSKKEPVAPFSGFSFKGSSQKTSKEQPLESLGASAFSFKGPDYEMRESVDLPSKKFLSDMKELFLKQEDCDVILRVKEQDFPAHRLILKARSSVFASTFKYDTKEKATGVIDIVDCESSSFSDFLYFLYCGSAKKFSSENVFNLFTAADKYDVQDLRSECMKFMKKNLSIDNFCDTIALALKHYEKELIELAIDFFTKNLQAIILTVKWQSFLVENPIQGNELLIKALSSNKK